MQHAHALLLALHRNAATAARQQQHLEAMSLLR
jgi:hypothetical protein